MDDLQSITGDVTRCEVVDASLRFLTRFQLYDCGSYSK